MVCMTTTMWSASNFDCCWQVPSTSAYFIFLVILTIYECQVYLKQYFELYAIFADVDTG